MLPTMSAAEPFRPVPATERPESDGALEPQDHDVAIEPGPYVDSSSTQDGDTDESVGAENPPVRDSVFRTPEGEAVDPGEA